MKYHFYDVDGIQVGITPTSKNKWGRGYDLLIKNELYVIGSEGMYDKDRPIKFRRGEEVYLSTFEREDGTPADSGLHEIVIEAIKKYAAETEPDYFREFK